MYVCMYVCMYIHLLVTWTQQCKYTNFVLPVLLQIDCILPLNEKHNDFLGIITTRDFFLLCKTATAFALQLSCVTKTSDTIQFC